MDFAMFGMMGLWATIVHVEPCHLQRKRNQGRPR